jgi:hypothetical protein
VRVDDFFKDQAAPFGGYARPILDIDLLQQLRRGPIAGHTDAEAALALTQLARREFNAYGTDGGQTVTEVGSREILRTLTALARRLNIAEYDPPFSDFATFRTYWTQNEGYGSWAARREMVTRFFEPLQQRLEVLEDDALSGELAGPVTPADNMGWPVVDEEVKELRRHFHAAQTVQDYRNIGNDCVAVLEALSATVYDPARHLREGETEPPIASTKNRLERYADDALPGPGNAEIRALVKKTIEFAQAVKHNPDGTRVRAGIAADAVIQLANILRRLADDN